MLSGADFGAAVTLMAKAADAEPSNRQSVTAETAFMKSFQYFGRAVLPDYFGVMWNSAPG